MKNRSVKLKITLWLTVLTAALSALLLSFMLSISGAVVSQTSMALLEQTVRANASQVSAEGGKLVLSEGFLFYDSGVYTLVYSEHRSLIAGQLPISFTADEAFENGLIRTVDAGNGRYLVLDLWLPTGWEGGFWLRGLMEAPEQRQTERNLLAVAGITLPLFILLAAVGAYGILRRALRPLERITATADAINEGRDLSRRIGLPAEGDEFSRLAAAFDRLLGRLERAFEAEKQFTADASHELRTPVSVIKSACEYGLQYDETPEERRETLAMIHRQAARMSELISQLLTLTRLEQGAETLPFAPLDLGELARSACEGQGYDLSRLTLDLQEGVTVLGDGALLARLVRNLVDNAFKYGRRSVWVSLRREGDAALLSVRDDGAGIPTAEQEKVWRRFYQIDPSHSGGEGAGLGLAMVRQIAQLHGGAVTLQSGEGAGSTFTLRLSALDGE